MTLEQLDIKLKELGCTSEDYCLHGLFGSPDDNDKLSINIMQQGERPEYEVYFKERGEKHSSKKFDTESSACEYFLDQISESKTIERVHNIKGLEGMTVNERLYESDLMDEFDRSRRRNKSRAEQILRILKVDEPSIKAILYK